MTAHEGELVGQGDVHVAEDVLVELGELRDLGAGDFQDAGDDLTVEERGHLAAHGRNAADNLRDVPDREAAVPRVDPLRRKDEVKVRADPKPLGLEHGEQELLGRPGIGRRLEDDQLGGAEMAGDLLRCGDDEGDVRILRFPQGGGNADDDRVGLREDRGVGGGGVPPVSDRLLESRTLDVLNVRAAEIQGSNPIQVRLQPCDTEPCAGELDGQGKADVALPDDDQMGVVASDALRKT